MAVLYKNCKYSNSASAFIAFMDSPNLLYMLIIVSVSESPDTLGFFLF